MYAGLYVQMNVCANVYSNNVVQLSGLQQDKLTSFRYQCRYQQEAWRSMKSSYSISVLSSCVMCIYSTYSIGARLYIRYTYIRYVKVETKRTNRKFRLQSTDYRVQITD